MTRSRVFFGWWILLAFFGIHAFTGGLVFLGMTVFFLPLQTAFELPAATITMFSLLPVIVGSVISPIVGFVADRIGPRALFITTAILIAVGFGSLSFATSASMVFASLLFVALGTSPFIAGVGPAVSAQWFVRRRGLAIGIVASGFTLGGMVVPLMALIERTWGWPVLARVVASGVLLIQVPLSLCLRRRPSDMGLQPDGRRAFGDTLPGETVPPAPLKVAMADASLAAAASSRAFWAIAIAASAASAGQQSVWLFLVPHLALDNGVDPVTAASLSGGLAVMGPIGQLLFGLLVDRFAPRFVLAAAIALSAAGVLLFAFAESGLSLAAFVLVFGVASGASYSVAAAILADYFGPRSFGPIIGAFSTTINLLAVAGQVAAARSFDLTGSYRNAILALAAVGAVGVGLAVLAARPPNRPKRFAAA